MDYSYDLICIRTEDPNEGIARHDNHCPTLTGIRGPPLPVLFDPPILLSDLAYMTCFLDKNRHLLS